MKKLLNLLCVVALAIGFVSCDNSDMPDSKYQSKLVGKWSLASITMTTAYGSSTITLPNPDMDLEALVFDLKKNGTCVVSMTAQGMSESLNGTYQVSDGKFLLTAKYEYDGEVETETTSLDIEELSGKKLVLKMSQPLDEDDPSSTMDLLMTFAKK